MMTATVPDLSLPLIEEQNHHLRVRIAELELALRGLQTAVHEARLLDIRKRFSLCVADAAASKALTP